MFAMAGFMKLTSAPADMIAMGLLWVETAPIALVRFIGIAEVLGAVGLILPAATRILPGLTTLAAMGLLAIQVLAFGLHTLRGEFEVLAMNLVLMAIAGFVIWGRSTKAPIRPRG
jgi:hypothetical protein